MSTDTEEKITLGSGVDGRIVAEYLSIKKTWDYRNGDPRGTPWMWLARKHKRPIRELKALVRRYHEQNEHPDETARHQAAAERFLKRECACGEKDNIRWTSYPYMAEILGIHDKHWICPDCVERSSWDI